MRKPSLGGTRFYDSFVLITAKSLLQQGLGHSRPQALSGDFSVTERESLVSGRPSAFNQSMAAY